ncbi:MAG: phenylacetate-CoA oxygenase subunit PaaI [Cyanobacteria bacterium]|nr:phenylacetate-CoA oxygenase subunit PaaI [Cyanobacteriota bacterium]
MITAEAFNARLQAGEKIESTDEMSDEYREALTNLLLQQADSELSGAYGYIPWIEKAPSIHEKLLVAQIAKDEIRHAYAMFKLLAELGMDVEHYIAQHPYAFRVADGNADIGTQRLTEDKRVNIFYYPIETWTDFILFNFLMDRGAGHQLEDTLDSSYAPWFRTIKTIFQEETMHMNHGDTWVKRLSENPETRAELQEGINKWYPRVMNIFGRPGAPKNQLYVKLGLKKRDNGLVRDVFKADVEARLEGTGVVLPDWVPYYEKKAV